MANIAETDALSVAAPPAVKPPTDDPLDTPDDPGEPIDWRPKRLVRTVLASVKCSREFGRQMAREAKRRRFFEGQARVFLGDALAWNWTIWRERFRDFTPVLDFIDPLSHLFLAANAVHPTSPDNPWSHYVAWMRGWTDKE